MASGEKSLEEELSMSISLGDQIYTSMKGSKSFKLQSTQIDKQVDRISQQLRSILNLATSSPPLYEPPVRRILCQVNKTLERVLNVARKHERSCAFTITSTTSNLRKLSNLLDASIGDLAWLLTVFGKSADGIVLSLPPIASNDPIFAWVWSYIAVLEMGSLQDQINSATELASLANDNDRIKKIITQVGGVPPLLKLLKQGVSPDAQIAAATALSILANDKDSVSLITMELGIPIIVQLLSDSPMPVQISVANLVSRMAENDPIAQEEFGKENAIKPLVSLLSFYMFLDERKPQHGKPTHSPDLKLKLQTAFAEALWLLSKGCASNTKKISETKGLLCLAKYIDKEKGPLQLNCLATVAEIAAVVECNADLKLSAFMTNSPAAKAIMDQLLRIIAEEDDESLLIPSIKSVGSLVSTYPIWETQVICPLVTQLNHTHWIVAIPAILILAKLTSPENVLCAQHSKAITEFGGVQILVRRIQVTKWYDYSNKFDVFILLCYLAVHMVVEEASLLSVLEDAVLDHEIKAHPLLKELIPKAIHHVKFIQQRLQS